MYLGTTGQLCDVFTDGAVTDPLLGTLVRELNITILLSSQESGAFGLFLNSSLVASGGIAGVDADIGRFDA